MPIRLISLFLLVFLLNLFLFHQLGATAFALLTSLILAYFFSLFISNKTLETHKIVIFGGTLALLLLNLLLIYRAQMFVQMVLAMGVLLITAILTYLLSTEIAFLRSLLELVLVPLLLILEYNKSILKITDDVIGGPVKLPQMTKDRTKKVVPYLTGLLIGIPVVLVLVQLFSLADPIFKNYAAEFFRILHINLSDQVITRIVFSAIIFAVFLPFIYLKGYKDFRNPITFLSKFSLHKQMTVVMVMVALTVGAFLIIQAPYVFANVPAETSLVKFGVATYSEYVKRGFNELTLISLLIYSMVWVGLILLRNERDVFKKTVLYYVQLIILGELLIFLFSIFRRVYLYQYYHGLTLVRIYGTWLLVFIVIMTMTLILRHFWQKRFVYFETAATLFLLLAFGMFNAESYIASTNPPHVNKRTDFVYLSRMSADGARGWIKSFGYVKETLSDNGIIKKEIINRDDRREIAYSGMIVSNLLVRYDRLVNKYGSAAERKDYREKVLASIKTGKDEKSEIFINPYFPTGFNNQDNPGSFYIINSPYWRQRKGPANDEDLLFTWNGAEVKAYKIMKKEIPIDELLVLSDNFFGLYAKIHSQPENEREYDTDISFDSPFL